MTKKEVCREHSVGVVELGREDGRARGGRADCQEWKEQARIQVLRREGMVSARLQWARLDKRSCHVGTEIHSLRFFFFFREPGSTCDAGVGCTAECTQRGRRDGRATEREERRAQLVGDVALHGRKAQSFCRRGERAAWEATTGRREGGKRKGMRECGRCRGWKLSMSWSALRWRRNVVKPGRRAAGMRPSLGRAVCNVADDGKDEEGSGHEEQDRELARQRLSVAVMASRAFGGIRPKLSIFD